jgi:hypothetical protein
MRPRGSRRLVDVDDACGSRNSVVVAVILGVVADEDELADLIAAALDRAGSSARPLQAPTLPALIDELDLWLEDEGQWREGRSKHWQSLLRDIERAVGDHPDAVLRHAGEPASLKLELRDLAGECGKDASRTEPPVRLRLRRLADRLRADLTTNAALEDSWSGLKDSAGSTIRAEHAARQLLALAGWSGHDEEQLRRELSNDLLGLGREDPGPASERLAKAAARIVREPNVASYVVWLRVAFAQIADPPTIDLGSVTIYRGDWLREQLSGGASDVAPEAKLGTPFGFDALDDFCRVERDTLEDHIDDMAVAYARIDVGRVLRADALRIARRTMAALAAYGTLNGAEPTLWQLEPSFLRFADGQYGSMTFTAPAVAAPTIRERTGMARDRTAWLLREDRDRLVGHLPVGESTLADVMSLLGWFRDAKRSTPAARLVLCDRVIERAAKHAGIAEPRRFVESYLIPSWAHGRIRGELMTLARLIRDDDFSYREDDSPEYAGYEEILHDETIELEPAPDGGFSVNLGGLVKRLNWVRDRVAPGADAQIAIQRLAPKLRTGKAAAAWFDELCETARQHEARRSRTRNALVHGGPVAESTVTQTLPFAERMASLALHALVNASLDGVPFVEAVVDQTQHLRLAKRQLDDNVAPETALFWG